MKNNFIRFIREDHDRFWEFQSEQYELFMNICWLNVFPIDLIRGIYIMATVRPVKLPKPSPQSNMSHVNNICHSVIMT